MFHLKFFLRWTLLLGRLIRGVTSLAVSGPSPTALRKLVWDRVVHFIHLVLGNRQYFFVLLDQVLQKISEVDCIQALLEFLDLLYLLIEVVLFIFFTFVLEFPVLNLDDLSVLRLKLILQEFQLLVSTRNRRWYLLRIERILFH